MWAYKTTICMSTGETPFHLAYGHKAVISGEEGLTSYQVSHYDEGRNEEGMQL